MANKVNANKVNGNCKEVLCLTDGKHYPGMKYAAKELGVTSSSMSYAIKNGTKCKGKEFNWASDKDHNIAKMASKLKENEERRACRREISDVDFAEFCAWKAEKEAEAKRKEAERKEKEKRDKRIAELKAKVERQQEITDKANARAATETNKLMALEMELEELMDEA